MHAYAPTGTAADHRMLCCDSQEHLPVRLRSGLQHDSMASLLEALLFVLRSFRGQTSCSAEGGLIAYKPYLNHVKRARAAPVRDSKCRRGRLQSGRVVSVVSCWRFRCRTDVSMGRLRRLPHTSVATMRSYPSQVARINCIRGLRQCIFPSPAILDARSASNNLLDSGSSRLIRSLLLVGVGTYMALQKVFDFMRWKAVKTQQFASLFKRHIYGTSRNQGPPQASIARASTAIQPAEQPHA